MNRDVKLFTFCSGIFLSIGELSINDWYIILLIAALSISILTSIIKLITWFVGKIKEAKKDDGKVSKAEMKQIAKELKSEFLREYKEIKSDSELVKEKIETLKAARSDTEQETAKVTIIEGE